jgi:hypothetical protein
MGAKLSPKTGILNPYTQIIRVKADEPEIL